MASKRSRNLTQPKAQAPGQKPRYGPKTDEKDVGFDGRNWFLLRRLSLRGYSPDEARALARRIEAGKLKLSAVDEKISSREDDD